MDDSAPAALPSASPGQRTEIKSFQERVNSLFKVHFKFIIGMFIPLIVVAIMVIPNITHHEDRRFYASIAIFFWMFWSYLFQPVNIPVTGIIPLFALTFLGVLPTKTYIKCYFNDDIGHFIFGNMALLLLCNCGLSNRIMLHFLSNGALNPFNLLIKCSLLAFFLSMFTNKLITCCTLTEFVATPLMKIATDDRERDVDISILRYIIANGIQVSANLGSLTMPHASYTVMMAKTCFNSLMKRPISNNDPFNYFDYFIWALLVAGIMFVVNLIYGIILITKNMNTGITEANATTFATSIETLKHDIPPSLTCHEKSALILQILLIVLLFTRYSAKHEFGWSPTHTSNQAFKFTADQVAPGGTIPTVRDFSVIVFIIILASALPNRYDFFNFFTAKTRAEYPPMRQTSGILFWSYIEKNTNYGYLFIFGSAVALIEAWKISGVGKSTHENVFESICDWGLPIVMGLIAAILSNIMSGTAMASLLLVAVNSYDFEGSGYRRLTTSIAIGWCSSFGYMVPFLYTSGYFCHKCGHVPRVTMAKYALGSVVICTALFCALTTTVPYLLASPLYGQSLQSDRIAKNKIK